MRIGKVLSINRKAGVGLISDSNGDRIIFSLKNNISIPGREDLVTFDICFRDGSLRAVDIAVLNYSPITVVHC